MNSDPQETMKRVEMAEIVGTVISALEALQGELQGDAGEMLTEGTFDPNADRTFGGVRVDVILEMLKEKEQVEREIVQKSMVDLEDTVMDSWSLYFTRQAGKIATDIMDRNPDMVSPEQYVAWLKTLKADFLRMAGISLTFIDFMDDVIRAAQEEIGRMEKEMEGENG